MQAETASGDAEAQPPNIILILTDDQGWTSMSAAMDKDLPTARSDYHRTPHMDSLAARGMRFSNGYAASPVCSPSRYSILFGKTPARLGKTVVRGPNHVDHTQLSLPQAIKQADERYVCAHFGKWHIAVDPKQVDYDASDGKTTNKEGEFTNGKPAEWSGRSSEDPKLINHVTNRGIAFMKEQTAAGRPFFLQLSHYAVHSDIVYRDKTLEQVKVWKQGEVHSNAGYAAMLKDLDDGIGKFLAAFDEMGISENTYIFFTSDNGGMPLIPPRKVYGAPLKRGLNTPLRRGKWDLTEGGVRVPFIALGPGIKPGSQCDTPVVAYDLFPTCAEIAGLDKDLPSDLDGGSLAPLLRDPTKSSVSRPLAETLIFHMPHYNHVGLGEPHSAIRKGRYKLLKFHVSGRCLLFDMEADPGERTDLSSKMPKRTMRMEQILSKYLAAVDAEKPEQSFTWKAGKNGKLKTKFFEAFQ